MNLLDALIKKLEGEIAMAKANIDIYINSSTGIGEHPEIAEAVESQIEKIAAAHEKIQIIEEYF